MDYKAAGVNIAAGEELVRRIKPAVARTKTSGVLSEIGLFGGMFDARFPDYEHPVLVASTDGVGTKLKVAIMAGLHTTVGHCLVNHCVNDILACGAKPLFFLDYYATGALDVQVAADVVHGLAEGCVENGCALLGGETAEMPSLYHSGDYDIAGTIVGVVEKQKVLNGSHVSVGDVLIGLPSSGLHTNGYSLARSVLFPKYRIDEYVSELGCTVGEALLAIHRSYLAKVMPLLDRDLVSAVSHITGGGLLGNTQRVLQAGQELRVDWKAWERPPIFNLIQSAGSVTETEMQTVFNLGIGMVLLVKPHNVHAVIEALGTEQATVIGEVIQSTQ